MSQNRLIFFYIFMNTKYEITNSANSAQPFLNESTVG